MLCNTCQNIEFRPTKDLEEKDGGEHAIALRRNYEALGDSYRSSNMKSILMSVFFHLPISKATKSALEGYWLKQCEDHGEGHDECLDLGKTNTVLPDYVVDVGDSSSSPQADAVLVKGNGRVAKYATLSYYWGDMPESAKTTTTNLAARLEAVNVTSLPQTLQGAISVARALDIRFIWINALCIIQDSHEHWEQQAALMSHIYRNSALTIAADAGPEAQLVFFVMRNPLAVRPCRLSAKTPQSIGLQDGGRSWLLCFERVSPRCVPALRHPVPSELAWRWPSEKAIEEHPGSSFLSSRGWTLQENLFFQRVLTFNSAGMWWRCPSKRIYESSPQRDALAGVPNLNNPVLNVDPVDWRRYENWSKTIVNYTERRLTFPTDKLPAFSALASAFWEMTWAANIEDTYLVGVWKNDLAHGLLWTPKDNSKSNIRLPRSPYIAPSFFCASLDVVSIAFPSRFPSEKEPNRVLQEFFSVVQTNCNILSQDPFGRISECSLTMSAKVMETRFFDHTSSTISSAAHDNDSLQEWDGWLSVVGNDSGLVVGMIRLDEQGELVESVDCMPLMTRSEYPFHVEERLDLLNKLLTEEKGLEWLNRQFRGHQSKDKNVLLERMRQPFNDSSQDDFYYYGQRRELYRCLALAAEKSGGYRQVGIAEIWDLEWFSDTPSTR
ncbi:hypothetical protein VTI74DRAFT_4239 [Chaetomium olivicolor]